MLMNTEFRQICPLCHSEETQLFYQKIKSFYQCQQCFGIFMDKNQRLTSADELNRYNIHQNDVHDLKYQNFVSPITSAIIRDFNTSHQGLDFGAGPGPVVTKVLRDHDYKVAMYDPFYHSHPKVLDAKYDYIACCEVIEHFYNPDNEFLRLKNLLRSNGKLYCMTYLYHDDINFDAWYYKNDPTHVFIYRAETIEWIKNHFGFSSVTIDHRLITFDF
jgi:SAM-dependent methyltransferase